MGNEYHGALALLLELEQLVLHLVADEGIQGREGLVHEHNRGIDGQGPGEAHPLLHAPRELVGIAVGVLLQSHLLQYRHGPFAPLVAPVAGHIQTEGNVLDHGAMGHQGEALENHRHLPAPQLDQPLVLHPGHFLVVDTDGAGGGLNEPVEHANKGGLARAGKAHDGENLAGLDPERGVLDPDGVAGAVEDLLLSESLFHHCQGVPGRRTEDLVEVLGDDLVGHLRGRSRVCLLPSSR